MEGALMAKKYAPMTAQERIDLYGVCEDCGKTNHPATFYNGDTVEEIIMHANFYCTGKKRTAKKAL
jgi:hypothetical protein